MTAAAAAAVKKAAAMLLTDKRTWKIIGSILAGLIMLCLLPAMVLTAMFSSAVDMDVSAPADLEAAMVAIEQEIANQGFDADPLKAQIIFLCVRDLSSLSDRANDENFYADFTSCFNGAEDDGTIFDNIAAKFGVKINADDRAKILSLYQNARESIDVSGIKK